MCDNRLLSAFPMPRAGKFLFNGLGVLLRNYMMKITELTTNAAAQCYSFLNPLAIA
jgi:hypothetical protein